MEVKRQQPLSHLFTVRLWREELGNGQSEVRGKVQHVSSGEVRYFRDWPMLIAFLEAQLTRTGLHQISDVDGGTPSHEEAPPV